MEYKFSKDYSGLYKEAEEKRDRAIEEAEKKHAKDFFDLEQRFIKERSEQISRRGFFPRMFSLLNIQEAKEKAELVYLLNHRKKIARNEFEEEKQVLFERFNLEQRASKVSDAEFHKIADLGELSLVKGGKSDEELNRELDERELNWESKKTKL